MIKDNLGTRLKTYEAQTTSTMLMPNLPVYARLDGRAFHNFCKYMYKPFDFTFIAVMQNVCKYLVDKTNAKLGYVQSDEISLCWEDPSKAPFDGRLFKLESVLASMATSAFTLECLYGKASNEELRERVRKLMPNFDCRVFQLPSLSELANCFIWRENDATRNAISMVAQANFSHSELQGKSSAEMQEMYFQKTGRNFNNFPSSCKRGTYFQRVNIKKKLDDETLAKIAPNKRPEDGMVIRTEVRQLELPIMKRVENKVGVYFYGETPVMRGEE